jgi:hypothetical protein
MWGVQGIVLDKVQSVMAEAVRPGVELNCKRNLVVYLFEVVSRHAEKSSEMRQKYFIEI